MGVAHARLKWCTGIETEEVKVTRNIKERMKKGDKESAKVLAKELVRSRKAKERMYESKAQLNSVAMQLQQNLCMAETLTPEMFIVAS